MPAPGWARAPTDGPVTIRPVPAFTKETAKQAQLASAASRAARVRKQTATAHQLASINRMSPRDAARAAVVELSPTAMQRLGELVTGPDPEAAMKAFWEATNQAYGKPVESLEVSAGPIPVAELETWSDERIAARLLELEAGSAR